MAGTKTDNQGVPIEAPVDTGEGKPTQEELAQSGYRLPDAHFADTPEGKAKIAAEQNKLRTPAENKSGLDTSAATDAPATKKGKR